LFTIVNCADQSRGDDRANAGDLLQAFSIRVAGGERFYGFIQIINTPV
jgi:hypothetical protein